MYATYGLGQNYIYGMLALYSHAYILNAMKLALKVAERDKWIKLLQE